MDATQADSSRSAPDVCVGRLQLRQRLGQVPVAVAVHLCHRPMKLSEFVALAPGSIVSFETPCAVSFELKADRETIAIGQVVRCGTKIGLRLSQLVGCSEASH